MERKLNYLFHVTPAANYDGIHTHGVNPACSQGRLKSSWWVEENRLLWAIAHVSARHHVPVDEIDIWATTRDCEHRRFIRFATEGVYRLEHATHADWVCNAEHYISGSWWTKALAELEQSDDFAPPPENINDIPF